MVRCVTELYELLDDRSATYRVLVSGIENWIDAGGAARRTVAVLSGGDPIATLGEDTDDIEHSDDVQVVEVVETSEATGAEGPDAADPAAGDAAATAAARTGPGALSPVAAFDVDDLVDHQARRPTMQLVDGVNVGLTWPRLTLDAARDRSGEPFLLLQGAEPDHLWRRFAASVVELAQRFGVEMVVSVGAYPAPVPHSRAVHVVSTATSDALAGRVGFIPGRLEVPASINAAIERACAEAGIPAVGLWAQVPHYVSNFPYPAASAALLDTLGELTGLRFPTAAFETAARQTSQRIDELIAPNEEHRAMVRELERLVDEQPAPGPLPSADELAAELEHFLRDQDDRP
jgi:PAC2 family